jgi:hypothetical protein
MTTEQKKKLLADVHKAANAIAPFSGDGPYDLNQLDGFNKAWVATLREQSLGAMSGLYLLVAHLEAEIGTDNL